MVVKRKISKERYVIAAVITLLIFIPGFLLGMVIDDQRIKMLETSSQKQELDIKSLQLNYLYMSYLQNYNNSCEPMKVSIEESIKELSKSLETIERYKIDSTLNNKDFNMLLRKYLIDNLNYWILSKRTKEICNLNTINVLYFFNSDCKVCPDQGIILTYFKKKLGDKLLVFPINTDIIEDESMIKILMTTYGVKYYPSLVIEEDLYEGITGKEELSDILCEKYGYNQTKCQEILS